MECGRVADRLAKCSKKWRRGRESNPRYPLRYVRFRGGSFQPLTHLSASDTSVASRHLTPDFLRLRSGQTLAALGMTSRANNCLQPALSEAKGPQLATVFKERLQHFCAA